MAWSCSSFRCRLAIDQNQQAGSSAFSPASWKMPPSSPSIRSLCLSRIHFREMGKRARSFRPACVPDSTWIAHRKTTAQLQPGASRVGHGGAECTVRCLWIPATRPRWSKAACHANLRSIGLPLAARTWRRCGRVWEQQAGAG